MQAPSKPTRHSAHIGPASTPQTDGRTSAVRLESPHRTHMSPLLSHPLRIVPAMSIDAAANTNILSVPASQPASRKKTLHHKCLPSIPESRSASNDIPEWEDSDDEVPQTSRKRKLNQLGHAEHSPSSSSPKARKTLAHTGLMGRVYRHRLSADWLSIDHTVGEPPLTPTRNSRQERSLGTLELQNNGYALVDHIGLANGLVRMQDSISIAPYSTILHMEASQAIQRGQKADVNNGAESRPYPTAEVSAPRLPSLGSVSVGSMSSRLSVSQNLQYWQRQLELFDNLVEQPESDLSDMPEHRWSLTPKSREPTLMGISSQTEVRPAQIRKLNTRQLVCPFCHRNLDNDRIFKDHLSNRHSGERPLSCDVCDKQYSCPKRFRNHILSHGSESNIDPTKVSKPYRCKHCNKEYCNMFHWALHWNECRCRSAVEK